MNVVFYVVDCLRADHVHALGYERATTPTIDALARDGALFASFYAQGGWTAPSAASMLSGRLPSATGIRCMRDALAPDLPWLPLRLRDAGFETAAFSAMAQVSTLSGFERGFDTFVESFRDPRVARACASRGQDVRDANWCLPLSEDLHAQALAWLDARRASTPFFLFVWSIDTHEPFRHPAHHNLDVDSSYRGVIDGRGRPFAQVRGSRDRQRVIDLYDGALRYQDEQLACFTAELAARDLLDDTLVVLVGDHGEMFWEHGLAGHGKFPWEEELRVPCVVRAPRLIRSGARIDALASGADLAPTIADVLGLPLDPRCDGASFARTLCDGPMSVREALTVEVPFPFDRRELARVVRRERWKLVEYTPPLAARRVRKLAKEMGRALASLARPGMLPLVYGNRRSSATELLAWTSGRTITRLYDLAADPGERCDRSRDEPRVVEELRAHLANASPPSAPTAIEPIDDEESRRLTAQLAELGYVDDQR